MKRNFALCAGAIGAALLSACGGGSDRAPAPAAPAASVVINSSNQDLVARAAANAVLSSGTAASVTPSSNSSQVQAASTRRMSIAGARSLSTALLGLSRDTLIGQVASKATAAGTSGAVRAQAVLSRTENCAFSGTATFALDDRDGNNQVSSGDALSVTFSQCRTSMTEMIDGSVAATYRVVQQTPAVSVMASVAFSQLTATSSEGSFAINGSFDFTLTRQGSGDTAQLSIGGNGLAATVATPNYTDTVTLLAGYNVMATHDSSAGLSTLAVNGAISAASLGGTIVLSTPLAIKQYDVDPYPREGQVQVRGANNGLLVLTVLSTTTVRVQLDANNDGAFEATKDVPWGDLI
ncbi:MAG: hypothetical protein N3D71_00020 [Burkholderiaceae bacterium]|nr:hypothetical protein [Burkholderiaceae bacterium]